MQNFTTLELYEIERLCDAEAERLQEKIVSLASSPTMPKILITLMEDLDASYKAVRKLAANAARHRQDVEVVDLSEAETKEQEQLSRSWCKDLEAAYVDKPITSNTYRQESQAPIETHVVDSVPLKPGQPKRLPGQRGRLPHSTRCWSCKEFFIRGPDVKVCWKCGVDVSGRSPPSIEEALEQSPPLKKADAFDLSKLSDEKKCAECTISLTEEEEQQRGLCTSCQQLHELRREGVGN